jgi:hypothetical protein
MTGGNGYRSLAPLFRRVQTRDDRGKLGGQSSSSSNALASFRSAVSNPSVNQPYTGARRSPPGRDPAASPERAHRIPAKRCFRTRCVGPDARQSLVVHHAARPVRAGARPGGAEIRSRHLSRSRRRQVGARLLRGGFAPPRARRRRRGSRPPADDRFAAASSRGVSNAVRLSPLYPLAAAHRDTPAKMSSLDRMAAYRSSRSILAARGKV